jgi:hypothetical protein
MACWEITEKLLCAEKIVGKAVTFGAQNFCVNDNA